jgi:hypothetical protein
MMQKLVEAAEQRHVLEEIRRIVFECEGMQQSNESRYTKEQAKLSAYEKIAKLMKGENDDR